MTLTFALPRCPFPLVDMPPKVSPLDYERFRPRRYCADERYVYRVDYLHSFGDWLPDRIQADGHGYRIPLDNILRHRDANKAYIDAIMEKLDRMTRTGSSLRAIYFWDNHNLVREFQLTHIRDFSYMEMDHARNVTGELKSYELKHIPVISRVHRSHLPLGIIIPDLNPQLTPFGLAHVVALASGEHVSIPSQYIEFWYRNQWTDIANIDPDVLRAQCAQGSLRSVVPAIPQYLLGGDRGRSRVDR